MIGKQNNAGGKAAGPQVQVQTLWRYGLICCFGMLLSFVSMVLMSTEAEAVAFVRAVSAKKITLLAARPAESFALQPMNDSGVVFYCPRPQWLNELLVVHANQSDHAAYIRLLDSLQKSNGVIRMQELNSHAADVPGVSAKPVSYRIFETLLDKGEVFIEYTDQAHVARIRIQNKKTEKGYIEYYKDARTGRVLYTKGHTTHGQF